VPSNIINVGNLLLGSLGGGSAGLGAGSILGIGGGAGATCNVVRVEGGPDGSTADGGATPAGGRCVFVNVLCCCGSGFVVVPTGAVLVTLAVFGGAGVAATFGGGAPAAGRTAFIDAGVGLRAPGGSGGGMLFFAVLFAPGGRGGGLVGVFGGAGFALGAFFTTTSSFVSEPSAVGIVFAAVGM
jgi:hypothetical protein